MINLRRCEIIGFDGNMGLKKLIRFDWGDGKSQYGIDKPLEINEELSEKDTNEMIKTLKDKIISELGELTEGVLLPIPRASICERLEA